LSDNQKLNDSLLFFQNKLRSFKSSFIKKNLKIKNNSVDNSSQTINLNSNTIKGELKTSEILYVNSSTEKKNQINSKSLKLKKHYQLIFPKITNEKKKLESFFPTIIEKKNIIPKKKEQKDLFIKIVNLGNENKKLNNFKKEFKSINQRKKESNRIIKNNSYKNVINFRRFNYDSESTLKKKIKKDNNNYINIYNISPEKKCVSIRLTSKIIGDIYI
jgi:hypothetical protein